MTPKPSIDPATFRQRYAIESMAGGGLLVDLTSGSYFRLNASAVEICRALLEGLDAVEVAAQLARKLACAPQEAAELLRSMETALDTSPMREDPIGPFRYVRGLDSYDLSEQGRSILTVDVQGQ